MDADLLIVGAGAAGIFAAAQLRALRPAARIVVLEAAPRPLQKVKISGGGRCNLTHACFEVARLLEHYPRGHRQLRGLLGRFGPADTMEWFRTRGVDLKVEADGRVFPCSDDSQTIIDGLLGQLGDSEIRCRTRVTGLQPGFAVVTTEKLWRAPRVLLASGGNPLVFPWLEALGHRPVAAVPSLFTFEIAETAFRQLAGVSLADCRARLPLLPGREQRGPLLFTHWGLSGPVILRLSAWGARELAECGYRTEVRLDLLPDLTQEQIAELLLDYKARHPRKQWRGECPLPLPRRLFQTLVDEVAASLWQEVSKKSLLRLAERCKRLSLQMVAKGVFKEEFVTAGGVPLDEVDLKTLESRRCPGLYLAGEVLNVDGLTGGFNFQNAWSGGWAVAQAVAARMG